MTIISELVPSVYTDSCCEVYEEMGIVSSFNSFVMIPFL